MIIGLPQVAALPPVLYALTYALLSVVLAVALHLRSTIGTQATLLMLLRRVMPQKVFELLMRRMVGVARQSTAHGTRLLSPALLETVSHELRSPQPGRNAILTLFVMCL